MREDDDWLEGGIMSGALLWLVYRLDPRLREDDDGESEDDGGWGEDSGGWSEDSGG
ncbi:hypothetical protein [Halopseudomonas salina]|uniref:hypothetical protein n=1 Tax=Halopseudomonas salina TaxID=1323744 RepID=UPI001664C94C|nr:hypothetical protein [Halopseudomonas salina]